MRLAVLFRRPLREILDWPASHVAVIAEYLAHEPAPDERVEYAVSQIAAIYVNAHRKKGASPHPLSDFLLFRDAWKRGDDKSNGDSSIHALAMSLGGTKRATDHS